MTTPIAHTPCACAICAAKRRYEEQATTAQAPPDAICAACVHTACHIKNNPALRQACGSWISLNTRRAAHERIEEEAAQREMEAFVRVNKGNAAAEETARVLAHNQDLPLREVEALERIAAALEVSTKGKP